MNRRRDRGAEVYDVLMTLRFSREEAKVERAWQTLCNLAGRYRDSDKKLRDGRRSWQPPKDWRMGMAFGDAGDLR